MIIDEIYATNLFQISHPNYDDVEKRWLAFEEIARLLSDEQVIFTSQLIIFIDFFFFICLKQLMFESE